MQTYKILPITFWCFSIHFDDIYRVQTQQNSLPQKTLFALYHSHPQLVQHPSPETEQHSKPAESKEIKSEKEADMTSTGSNNTIFTQILLQASHIS